MFKICISITTTVISGLLVFFVKEYIKLKKQLKEDKEEKMLEEKRKQEDRDELLLGVARILLLDKMQTSLDRGYTTQAEYDVIEALYIPYINAGGNGTVKHTFEDRYNSIKIKKE